MELKLRGRVRSNRSILVVVSLIGILFCYVSALMYINTLDGPDSAECRIVYMGPSYARIKAFDESHTHFASKYSLYLYREQGKDHVPNEEESTVLDGIPVLFIPGNAGSYRQVRSIAAETANLYFDEFDRYKRLNPNVKNFDFFAADFNEDFTAFHGRTILDQAEYLNEAIKFILLLYVNNENPPKSVIILAHSMGGVVARVMVSLPNYVSDSINTIITLSSPHAAAPLTFDGDILKIYSAVDRFWFDGFSNKDTSEHAKIAKDRLRNLSLVSITGGALDTILPADYTSLGYLVPPENGFTVYTTGIPHVWTPMDHLAVVWCAQLRRQILKTLLEIADSTSPFGTYALETRMKIMKRNLLSGLEDYMATDLINMTNEKIQLKLDASEIQWSDNHISSTIFKKDGTKTKDLNIRGLKIKNNSQQLNLLSSDKIESWKAFLEDNANFAFLLCNENKEELEDAVDFTKSETQEIIALTCKDFSIFGNDIPNTLKDVKKLADSSFGGGYEPFHSILLNSTHFEKFDFAIIIERFNAPQEEHLLITEISEKPNYVLGKDAWSLSNRGASILLPPDRPLCTYIEVPGASSSLLAYRLLVSTPNTNDKQMFNSFIRQWTDVPFETKWHLNIEDRNNILLTMHGIAPYTPFKIKSSHGLNLMLWSDPTIDRGAMELNLSIDYFNSMRLLIIRYRLAILSYCVLVTLSVFYLQLNHYYHNSTFPSFIFGLSLFCSPKLLGGICLLLSLLTPIMKNEWIKEFLNMIDPVVLQDKNEINLTLRNDYNLNSFYLGLEESYLWFLGPLFLFVGIAIVLLTYLLLLSLGLSISKVAKKLKGKNKNDNIENTIHQPQNHGPYRLVNNRTIIGGILTAAITFFIPYQLAYVVCCLIQVINCLKVLSKVKPDKNVFNYQLSVLILMLWILPISVPTIIVFVHNLTVNWKTPFSSHHNFLSILPILLLMERNLSLTTLPSLQGKFTVTKGLIFYFAFYCLVYGIRHTFWLHHLLNFFCCWLLVVHYDSITDHSIDKQT